MIDTRNLGERVAELSPLSEGELAQVAESAHEAGGVSMSVAEVNACVALLRGTTPTLRWLSSHSEAELKAHLLQAHRGLPTQLQRIVATYFGLQALLETGWAPRD